METAGMTPAVAEAAVGSCWRAKGFIRCSIGCILPSSINLVIGAPENTAGYCAPRPGYVTKHIRTIRTMAKICRLYSVHYTIEYFVYHYVKSVVYHMLGNIIFTF